ncbi:hypothetical protein [Oceanidesulfovibrio marinus]|uniref:Uncharacterized protein n=1 Tax=Oceanidesulfovibrio marinus TaxID=370038 RepID=A0ABX6NKD2_9BACT|nr:hypothetical protein [Oceanidesulfovibrio marinus]QJT11131.1 hypothetical protein E8L03_20420 [Oceanidesulfovibrio marinus]
MSAPRRILFRAVSQGLRSGRIFPLVLGLCLLALAGQAAAQEPVGVYISKRLPHVAFDDCTLREERLQGPWRFLRRLDLAGVSPERVSYFRGEDGRYGFTLHGIGLEKPAHFLQQRDGAVVSEHEDSSITFISTITGADEAAGLARKLRTLVQLCASRKDAP